MEILESMLKTYSEKGIAGIIVTVFIFALTTSGYHLIKFLYPYFLNIIFNKNTCSSYCLTTRKFLNFLHYMLSNVDIKCEKRKAIFVDYVRSRIENIIKAIEEIKEKQVNNLKDDELYYFIVDIIWKALQDSDRELLLSGAPKKVLDKYKEVEEDEVRMLDKLIVEVCSCKAVYKNNEQRVTMILNFLSIIADTVILNGEKTIDKLNGQLDGIIYKGISCDNCSVEGCKHRPEKKDV